MTEYQIVIDPRSKDSPHPSILVELRPDRETAEIDAEALAEVIEAHGVLPPAYDVHPSNRIPAAVVRRYGRATWLIRTDTFEFEDDDRYDEGYGWLRVREA